MNPFPLRFTTDEKWKILEVELSNGEKWRRVGKCLRCGYCCERRGCDNLSYEIWNGERRSVCSGEWTKPWQCKQFPVNPYDPKHVSKDCGYKWERI